MLVCFAGGILSAPLMGEPMLDSVNDPKRLAIATILWYAIYFTPNDLLHDFLKLKGVKTALCVIKGNNKIHVSSSTCYFLLSTYCDLGVH